MRHISLSGHKPKKPVVDRTVTITSQHQYSRTRRLLLLAYLATAEGNLDVFNTDLEDRTRLSQIKDTALREQYVALTWLLELVRTSPYSYHIHAFTAEIYNNLGYPDLAAGSAYKAVLLHDATLDDSDEYWSVAVEAAEFAIERWKAQGFVETSQWSRDALSATLASSLLRCGCLRSAHFYCMQSIEQVTREDEYQSLFNSIQIAAKAYYDQRSKDVKDHNPNTWPDAGLVRRELYAWNDYEPDRLHDLDHLNELMEIVAPKLEVKVARLPALTSSAADDRARESIQLGVFAKEDLEPGEIVLKEVSLLTANNKLQEALCDACSVELPELAQAADTMACEECQVVFCSQKCHDLAQASYHPALCDREVESIAKDVPLAEASDSLYSLLLLRSLAMAETQDCHPLQLTEVKYIWGDFNDVDFNEATATNTKDMSTGDETTLTSLGATAQKTLPFSFKYNISLPLHMLEKMNVNIFDTSRYDTWVLNTLYAKFRGTASARLSGLGGRAIRGPEVCAVHPMWCLANHSCDPNVSWKWGGEIAFRVREHRVGWNGRKDEDEDEDKVMRNQPGVKKGEEILNHYCDIELPVKQRREWARGALGGDCMCERCVWETQQAIE